MVTRAVGSVYEPVGQASGTCLCAVDPYYRFIAINAFDGLLRLIPINEAGAFDEMFTVPIDPGTLIDMCFLYCRTVPTLFS